MIQVSNPNSFAGSSDPWHNPDIILAGGGLAGLTLALELARRPFFQQYTILLIDRDEKARNDRTWCFWATPEEPLPPVLYRTWPRGRFLNDHIAKTLDIAPYRYCMVRGLDFYRWAAQELAQYPHVRRMTANITGLDEQTGLVRTDQGNFTGNRVFNSAFSPWPLLPAGTTLYPQAPFTPKENGTNSTKYVHLLQHFQGWIIESAEPAFDKQVMTFMDYRLDQHDQTRFVYVLPFSATRALVEFTVFSPDLCPAAEYDRELDTYIRNCLKIKDYAVEEREFGVIPMTDRPFPLQTGKTIHIGTVGGFVKPSSGYAFLRTQRRLRAFAETWAQTGQPEVRWLRSAWRYRFFDSVMLHVLRTGRVSGAAFFTALFRRLPAPLVFRFLDEDAGFLETLRLLAAPPTWPFMRTALETLWKVRV